MLTIIQISNQNVDPWAHTNIVNITFQYESCCARVLILNFMFISLIITD